MLDGYKSIDSKYFKINFITNFLNNKNSKKMNEEDFDFLLKIVIIGDSGVGKSNLLLRYAKDEFQYDSKATIGVDFAGKPIKIGEYNVKAQFWDTAGQDKYRAITSAYYKNAPGAI